MKSTRWIDGIAAGAKIFVQFSAPIVGLSCGFGSVLPAKFFAAFSSAK